MLRHLHGFKFFNIISIQIVVVVDVGINIVEVQISSKINQLLNAVGIVAVSHSRLEPLGFILAHVVQLGDQIFQLLQIDIIAQQVIETVHIEIVVRN